jgi:hypothetical protein
MEAAKKRPTVERQPLAIFGDTRTQPSRGLLGGSGRGGVDWAGAGGNLGGSWVGLWSGWTGLVGFWDSAGEWRLGQLGGQDSLRWRGMEPGGSCPAGVNSRQIQPPHLVHSRLPALGT